MDRAEAGALAQAELKRVLEAGYDRLQQDAPRDAPGPEQPPRFLRWLVKAEQNHQTRKAHQVRGESGTLYQVVREVDWDDKAGGALRVWIAVDDGYSATEPEVADGLLHPSPNREA